MKTILASFALLFLPAPILAAVGDAAPTTGEVTVSASTPAHAGTHGRETRIAALREITRVHLIRIISWLASLSGA